MVVQLLKMNYIFFVCWVIVLYGLGAVKSYGTVIKSPKTCRDDVCLFKNNNYTENISNFDKTNSKISYNIHFTNDSKYINESKVYFVTASEKPLDVSVNMNNITQKHQKVTISNMKLQFFSNITEKSNPSVNYTEELFTGTDPTKISEFTSQDFFDSTVESNFTKTTSLSTVKLSIPTTQSPFIASHFFLSQSYKNSKKICFCDIQVNQCDTNCCCDEDCSPFHFKVFTKCHDNAILDTRYCYKNNFIFGNNTFQKIILNDEGLFCIVKENLKFDLEYKSKTVIKTLEAFNKSLPKNSYAFFYKSPEKLKLMSEDYVFGSNVWSFQNGELTPFKIPYASVGFLCNSEINIKYLVDQVKLCVYQQQFKTQCKGLKIEDVFQRLKDIKIISNPHYLNKSHLFKSSEICKTNMCIGITSYFCQHIDNKAHCIKISENSNIFSQIDCWSSVSYIQYKIWHNGTQGIMKMDALLWVKKLPRISNGFLSQLTTEIKFIWMGFSDRVFERSGSPGYLTGKPILAGRKIYNVANDTSNKKEAIQLSDDPRDWLTVLGSAKGICSSKDRIPINFRENSQNICSLKLNKNNFNKERCAELQINIFKLLIGNDIINDTKENFFNKFVATFGNSRVEETEDWVQVLIDLFPIVSNQASFKLNHYHLTCKNVITDLYIDIVYSNIGSFVAPQAKILGVAFQFGKHKDLNYYCDTPGCRNTSFIQYIKLSSSVHFVDVTRPAINVFAEPLSLEAKLPYDFFYPFFSKSTKCQNFNEVVVIFFCLNIFFLILPPTNL